LGARRELVTRSVNQESPMSVYAAISGVGISYHSRWQRKRRSAERFPPFDCAQGAPSNVEGRLA
jgi:hypothetical protein